MANPNDMQTAMNELKAALKPLESLAESMRGLDNSHRLQADLQLINECYTEKMRQDFYEKLDAAFEADSRSQTMMTLISNRNGDQRTFEQYAEAHGPKQASLAFTTRENAVSHTKLTQEAISLLRVAHPVLYRVYSQLK